MTPLHAVCVFSIILWQYRYKLLDWSIQTRWRLASRLCHSQKRCKRCNIVYGIYSLTGRVVNGPHATRQAQTV